MFIKNDQLDWHCPENPAFVSMFIQIEQKRRLQFVFVTVTGASHTEDLVNMVSSNLSGTDLEISKGMVKRFISFIITGYVLLIKIQLDSRKG